MIHEDIRSKMTAISGLFLPLDGPIESRVESRQLFIKKPTFIKSQRREQSAQQSAQIEEIQDPWRSPIGTVGRQMVGRRQAVVRQSEPDIEISQGENRRANQLTKDIFS